MGNVKETEGKQNRTLTHTHTLTHTLTHFLSSKLKGGLVHGTGNGHGAICPFSSMRFQMKLARPGPIALSGMMPNMTRYSHNACAMMRFIGASILDVNNMHGAIMYLAE